MAVAAVLIAALLVAVALAMLVAVAMAVLGCERPGQDDDAADRLRASGPYRQHGAGGPLVTAPPDDADRQALLAEPLGCHGDRLPEQRAPIDLDGRDLGRAW